MNADSTMQDGKGKITRVRVHLKPYGFSMVDGISLTNEEPVEVSLMDYNPEEWMIDTMEDRFFQFIDDAGAFNMIPTERIAKVVVLKEAK